MSTFSSYYQETFKRIPVLYILVNMLFHLSFGLPSKCEMEPHCGFNFHFSIAQGRPAPSCTSLTRYLQFVWYLCEMLLKSFPIFKLGCLLV